MVETLEQSLLKDFLEKIDSSIKLEEQLLSSTVLPHEEYAEHVGKANGLRLAKETFLVVVRAYFPMR